MTSYEAEASHAAKERRDVERAVVREPSPTAPVSRRAVQAGLAEANAAFRRSWKIFELLVQPRYDEGGGQAILGFQRGLLAAIVTLERLYRRIRQEQKRLIQRKARLNARWFAHRMAVLSGYLPSIEDTLAIGRAIGDGFAWFFYERDRPLVLEHYKHQRQKLLPPGVGALGERLTVENMPSLDGKLLLYHGITTFLRMGDVSLVDLSTLRVACIGELKTEKVAADQYAVQMAFVAGNPQKLPRLPANARRPEAPRQLPQAMAARRDRQIREMVEALGRIGEERERAGNRSMRGGFHFAELDEVVARSHYRGFEYVQAGPAMVIGAVRLLREGEGQADLFGRQRRKVDHLAHDAPTWAMKTLIAGMTANSLQLGTLGGGADMLVARAEGIPFVWWPVKPETLRQILFGEVLVITIYNPAHLWDRLRSGGFELEFDAQHNLKRGVRCVGKLREEIKNFDYFHRMIQGSLMTLDSVSTMIDEALSDGRQKHADVPVRVEIRPIISRKVVPRRNRSTATGAA